MSQTKLASLLAIFGLLLTQTPSFAGTAWAPASGSEYVQDQILVKFKSGVATAARTQVAQTYGAQAIQAVGEQSDLVLANLIPGQTVEQAVSAYANDPNVEYAQPNYIYHALAAPTETNYALQWAAKNTGQVVNGTAGTPGADMNLESAWAVQTSCSSVLVAVVDTGINYNSTDLTNEMWIDATDTKHGRNFSADVATGVNSDPMDLAGHGTHVAGIIGAQANNGFAGSGVCWTAKLMAVRVLDATGSGTTTNIVSGINYAIAKGVKIINMSLGGTSNDPTFSQAITDARTAGVLVVVAAGNDTQNNETTPHYPCNYTQSNLICVAALDQNYALATYSDWGATSVDVGAPGTNIYSTWAGTNATITDASFTGWTFSSTTSGAGGGWASSGGWLLDPMTNWGTAKYNANTDDRVWKQFNLSGTSVAILKGYIAINVKNGDYFRLNYKVSGGDPFVGGVNYSATTNLATGMTAYFTQANISPCISATCSVGFQLTSIPSSVTDLGLAMTSFSITTLTLTPTGTNTISGTSMATPEVVGVAALVWAHNPSYTYTDVVNAIKNGGRSIGALTGKTTTGKAVDALGALAYINPPTGIAVVVH